MKKTNNSIRCSIITCVLTTGFAIASATSIAAEPPSDYNSNLSLIQSASPRNTNHDSSPWRNTPQRDLELSNHLGPRTDYLGLIGGNSEQAFPDEGGGQFRISCEFSHFSYDDPIVNPGQPGASHLHMYWGNTDVNAFSTYESLINSGSSTCNGQEINRSAYWAPAMFDGNGNVRIPMRIIVYYKGYGLAKGRSEAYPPGAAIIAKPDLHTIPADQGGVLAGDSEKTYQCSDQFRGTRSPQSNTIPNCTGTRAFLDVLEMHVKFPNCWNRQDASNPANWSTSRAGVWYYSECQDWATTPNIEYIIQYPLDEGESTEGWHLASDVDRDTLKLTKAPGSTAHGDWWGGWREDVNQTFLDECVNLDNQGRPSGCGMGYLSDNGPDGKNPLPGPALKFRPQYDTDFDQYGNSTSQNAYSVPASTVFEQLCVTDRRLDSPEEAAWCVPNGYGSTDLEAPSNPTAPENPISNDLGTGLRATYFDDPYFQQAVVNRVDNLINHPSFSKRKAKRLGLTDNTTFSAEWNGYLVSNTDGPTTIWTESDDGVRVYVNGILVIDNWTYHTKTRDEAVVELSAGKPAAIAVQYYQAYGESVIRLGWQRPGRQDRIIHKSFLYPAYLD